MDFDLVELSRLQFAMTAMYHFLFVPLTLGLSVIVAIMETVYVMTNRPIWRQMTKFWGTLFGINFVLGVATGITMEFQFGMNWSYYSHYVGDIFGAPLAIEGLMAFFLEATFVGLFFFGWDKLTKVQHLVVAWLVALGSNFSALWILIANSWMHTPAGFEMIDGQAHVTSWMQVIFNPSFPYRLTHMLIASGLTVSFLLAGISAYRWLRHDRGAEVMATLKVGIYAAAVLIPLQIVVGDLHGLNTLEHQPAKLAAMEGIWQTQKGAPAVLFGLPDAQTQSNRYEVSIPKLASFYLTHDWNGEIQGIAAFGDQHPPVAPVFWAFRIMVGIGLLMLVVSWFNVWRMRRGRALAPWMARVLVAMTFSGWLALVSGWYVTEIGRQPWLVQGVLTAAQAASAVPAANIAFTLVMYLLLYAALLLAYVRVIFHLASKPAKARQDLDPAGVAPPPTREPRGAA